MKKTFLSVLLGCFVLVGVVACGESKDGGPADVNPAVTGSYKVDFFGTQVKNPSAGCSSAASLVYISNDCAKAKALYPGIVDVGGNQCIAGTQIDNGTVAADYQNGQVNITSKMEMSGGALIFSPSDVYQFTIYNPTAKVEGKGVQGSNFDNATKTQSALVSYPDSTFKIITDDGTNLDIEMTLVGKAVPLVALPGQECVVDAVTRIQATRIGDYQALTNSYPPAAAPASN